jgi:type II secretion system protein I
MKLRSGFTLLEAVVALAIISLVAVASLASVGTQLRATDHARHTTEAIALAQERLTAVQLLSFNDLQSLPDSIASGRFTAPLDMYRWRVNAQPVSDAEGLNTVTVQVEWPDGAYTLASRVYHSPPSSTPSGGDANSSDQSGGGAGTGLPFSIGSDGQIDLGGGNSIQIESGEGGQIQIQMGGAAGGGGFSIGGSP